MCSSRWSWKLYLGIRISSHLRLWKWIRGLILVLRLTRKRRHLLKYRKKITWTSICFWSRSAWVMLSPGWLTSWEKSLDLRASLVRQALATSHKLLNSHPLNAIKLTGQIHSLWHQSRKKNQRVVVILPLKKRTKELKEFILSNKGNYRESWQPSSLCCIRLSLFRTMIRTIGSWELKGTGLERSKSSRKTSRNTIVNFC